MAQRSRALLSELTSALRRDSSRRMMATASKRAEGWSAGSSSRSAVAMWTNRAMCAPAGGTAQEPLSVRLGALSARGRTDERSFSTSASGVGGMCFPELFTEGQQ